MVHPDKNPGEDARKAFDALSQAHKALRDPGQLVGAKVSLAALQAVLHEAQGRLN